MKSSKTVIIWYERKEKVIDLQNFVQKTEFQSKSKLNEHKYLD